MEGLVSIIVPVYRAEKYLARCVDSIISQTYQNWELLLVDDGSPDNSGILCDNYAASDKRIRVFHKKNGGVSSARQCGLDNAKGEYVIHADPDDWVEPEMIEFLYLTARKEDSDMVICDFFWDSSVPFVSKQKPMILSSESVLNSFFEGELHASCWNKLIRSSLFKKYDIKFPLQLSLYEDLFVNSSLLLHKLKISYVPQAFYHYDVTINPDSISKSYTESSYKYDQLVCNLFKEKFASTDVYPKVKTAMIANMIRRAYNGSNFSSLEFMSKFFRYRNIFLKCKYLAFSEKVRYYFSCIGFFGLFKIRRRIVLNLKNKKWFIVYE